MPSTSVPRKVVKCHFRIGKDGVKKPVPRMWEHATPKVYGVASAVNPHKAICNSCKFELNAGELFNQELTKLACPNCYSDNLSLTEIEFELGYLKVRKDVRHRES